MVTDKQVRILMKLINQEKTLLTAAAKAGMCEKTARKYRKSGKLPSQCKPAHDWATHEDAFNDDWPWVEEFLKNNPGLEAKTLFEALQREKPGKYQDGQLRTFQRRVKLWRALHGSGREVFFPQIYQPGQWSESDFTRMKNLNVTINGRDEYEEFLEKMFDQLNAGRKKHLGEKLRVLRQLPSRRHDDYTERVCKVGRFSTIRVLKNSYSLHSRLIGEQVKARIYAEHIEAWYAQRRIEVLPRLRGEKGHYINYRHIIDWLVRKPGAFENYRYKEDLFPTSQFRIAYDLLRSQHGQKQGNKEYLKVLKLAAKESETLVNESLRFLINRGDEIHSKIVKAMVRSQLQPPPITDIAVDQVDLTIYDQLLEYEELLIV